LYRLQIGRLATAVERSGEAENDFSSSRVPTSVKVPTRKIEKLNLSYHDKSRKSRGGKVALTSFQRMSKY
jgi:hypothetical protein